MHRFFNNTFLGVYGRKLSKALYLKLRKEAKTLGVFLGLGLFFLGFLLRGLVKGDRPLSPAEGFIQSTIARWVLLCARVRLRVIDPIGVLSPGYKKSYLVVANHISYLDIVGIMSTKAYSFVTSKDLGETPGLGWLVRVGGAIFVERRKKMQTKEDVEKIKSYLEAFRSVMFFPEAGTSDGLNPLKFRSSLFEGAVRAKRGVLVMRISYPRINAKAFGPQNKDLVAWYGSMTFWTHLRKLLAQDSVEMLIEILRVMESSEQLENRKTLCAEAYHSIFQT